MLGFRKTFAAPFDPKTTRDPLTRDKPPVRICSEEPTRTCCFPQTFAFRFPSEDFFQSAPAPRGFAYRSGF